MALDVELNFSEKQIKNRLYDKTQSMSSSDAKQKS